MNNHKFKLIGELPPGDWTFCLVQIKNRPDVIVVLDSLGAYAPRVIVNSKLIELVT